MEYISSDTNVWFDFNIIDRLELPFKLSCTYIMFYETVENEILYPKGLAERLVSLGLQSVDITTEEYFFAGDIASRYPALSIPDRIALSIAKHRNIMLLTGDRALRNAAVRENVRVIGSIGLLDRLYDENCITENEYKDCIQKFINNNGNGVRLPEDELKKRL